MTNKPAISIPDLRWTAALSQRPLAIPGLLIGSCIPAVNNRSPSAPTRHALRHRLPFLYRPRTCRLRQLGLTQLVIVSVILSQINLAEARQVAGLRSPHSFLGDPAGKEYFISNVNGESEVRDNNGFITKLDAEGKVVNLKFVQGGGEVTLHAPKGMALVNRTLYVADLDTLRAFDQKTGRPVLTLPLTAPPKASLGKPVSLVDVAWDGRTFLYVSDSANNAIYRVDIGNQHDVVLLVHDERLARPSGLAVHPKSGHIIAVSWDKGKILEITPEGVLTELVSNGFFTARFQNLSGVDFDRWGNMYVSDQTKGKIWRMTPNHRFQVIAEYLPSPADIGIDRNNNLILVPYQYADAAEINGLEAPTEARSKGQKRTLADYGFVPPPPKPQPERATKK